MNLFDPKLSALAVPGNDLYENIIGFVSNPIITMLLDSHTDIKSEFDAEGSRFVIYGTANKR